MAIEEYEQFGAYNEAYEVVQTVQVVGHDQQVYRIEVLRCYSNKNTPYVARAYVEKNVSVKPDYKNGLPSEDATSKYSPEYVPSWVKYEQLPWTSRSTAESALDQALGVLADHIRKRPSE